MKAPSFSDVFPRDILGSMSQDGPRPRVGVGVVFMREGRVYLAKRQGSHGEATWGSAGGHLELGESLEGCARREALEELGVKVRDLRFLCVSNIIAYDRHYLDIEFLGEIGDQEPPAHGRDLLPVGLVSPWTTLPNPSSRRLRYALDSVRSGRHYHSGDRAR